MQLTVLGGSAAGPNPGQGCSGYLLRSGPTALVIDLGPGTLPELRKHVDFREIDGIVLTHLHLDHWLDLLALRFALAYNPVPPRATIPLWLPPEGIALLERLASAIDPAADVRRYFAHFHLREYDPRGRLSVGELTVRFHPTVHYIPCWAIRASNGHDRDLFYTADTGPSADLAPFARGSLVVVAEGTAQPQSREPLETRGHLTPTEAGALARQVGAGLLVLTHTWMENDPFVAMEDARRAFGTAVELAVPGLTVSWTDRLV